MIFSNTDDGALFDEEPEYDPLYPPSYPLSQPESDPPPPAYESARFMSKNMI